MSKAEFNVSKRDNTLIKIELASEAIRAHNKAAKAKVNKKYRILVPKIMPEFVHTARRTPRHMAIGTKGMDSITYSNKRLCGLLSQLCNAMRRAGITYPWKEVEA